MGDEEGSDFRDSDLYTQISFVRGTSTEETRSRRNTEENEEEEEETGRDGEDEENEFVGGSGGSGGLNPPPSSHTLDNSNRKTDADEGGKISVRLLSLADHDFIRDRLSPPPVAPSSPEDEQKEGDNPNSPNPRPQVVGISLFATFSSWWTPILSTIRLCSDLWNVSEPCVLIYGFISRVGAENLLETCSEAGVFIIRFSERNPGQLAIAFTTIDPSAAKRNKKSKKKPKKEPDTITTDSPGSGRNGLLSPTSEVDETDPELTAPPPSTPSRSEQTEPTKKKKDDEDEDEDDTDKKKKKKKAIKVRHCLVDVNENGCSIRVGGSTQHYRSLSALILDSGALRYFYPRFEKMGIVSLKEERRERRVLRRLSSRGGEEESFDRRILNRSQSSQLPPTNNNNENDQNAALLPPPPINRHSTEVHPPNSSSKDQDKRIGRNRN